jgi:predicted alpha-1,6-mannanase (GH76 family)
MRSMVRFMTILCLSICLLPGGTAQSLDSQQPKAGNTVPAIGYLQDSKQAVERMQAWYTPSTGLYESTGWWNSANAITVLADYARVSKSTQYNSVLANTFAAAQKTNPAFLNKFYDDEGWWALAWIDAYDLTRDEQYLSMAQSIFADMAGGWDDTCNGGIWWSKDRRYKAAIANELFLSVAAHLANRTSGAVQGQYLLWANREWSWFQNSGVINSKHLVNDGLRRVQGQGAGAECVNNGQTTWSYNQGVVLGGLAELSRKNPDPALPQAAREIATSAITLLTDKNGILHDPCEPNCGADGVQFKGIFARNLTRLDKSFPQAAYKAFIDANAESVWKNAQGADVMLGQVWSGPFKTGDAGSQSSALDVLVGAATLETTK